MLQDGEEPRVSELWRDAWRDTEGASGPDVYGPKESESDSQNEVGRVSRASCLDTYLPRHLCPIPSQPPAPLRHGGEDRRESRATAERRGGGPKTEERGVQGEERVGEAPRGRRRGRGRQGAEGVLTSVPFLGTLRGRGCGVRVTEGGGDVVDQGGGGSVD